MDRVDFTTYAKQVKNTQKVFNCDEVWKITKEHIKLAIQDFNFNRVFKTTYLEDIRNGVAYFSCKDDTEKSTILLEYKKVVEICLLKSTGQNLVIEINVNRVEESKEDKYQYYTTTNTQQQTNDLFSSYESEKNKLDSALQLAKINPKYTFENFIVGPHNRLAEAVAQAVVNDLGRAYNPVFFYGNTGVGKTHLMQAIGNEILKEDASRKVVYVSIEQFLNEMIEAIRTKKNEDFRSKYREVDLLIIDDVQFVETYPKTQEELFHTFNTLYQANKQIILASDRPPKEIRNITDRLRSRFEGGMVADIQAPDYETRIAILKQAMVDKGANIPNEYIDLIAKNIENNVRELEGSLNKVITLMKLGDEPTYEEVARILQVDIDSKRRKISPQKVLKTVSEVFDTPITDIKGSRRTAYVALTRQIVMYILREDLALPLEKIAREVNRKDHTTVLHACERINERMNKDSRFKEKIEMCRKELSK